MTNSKDCNISINEIGDKSDKNLYYPPEVQMIQTATSPTVLIGLDNAQRISKSGFPHQPNEGSGVLPCTIPNVDHLLRSYGITVKYDVVRKKIQILLPGYQGSAENSDNVSLTQVISLAALNGLNSGMLPSYIEAIADRNQLNHVANWIKSKAWDGVDRLPDLYNTLTEKEGYPKKLKECLLLRWLISAVAAALKPIGFRNRGVLVLQGPQSIGKTSWFRSLIPESSLRDNVIKLDHFIDASNKDTLLTAICHWIVELGELESSLRRETAKLKAFITSTHDKVRRPYGRSDSEYPRRTVFCASVNDAKFLVDKTGNSRWWTIPVTHIQFKHNIDMQQVFAQVATQIHEGEQWWLTDAEEMALSMQNQNHSTVSALHERLADFIDLDGKNQGNLCSMTTTELLHKLGISNPTNGQCKDCTAFLREHIGESKRIRGREKWHIQLRDTSQQFPHTERDDLYD